MVGERTQNIDGREVTRELPRTVARRQTKRVLKTVLGSSLVAAGIAFMVVPFIPGFPLLFLGLAVLATEFHWARRVQAKVRSRLRIGRRRSGRTR